MLERDKLEVDKLDERPDEVVCRQGGPVRRRELFGHGPPFEDGHGGEEDADEGRGEEALVGGHAGEDGAVWGGGEPDVGLEEAEPGCCCWAED